MQRYAKGSRERADLVALIDRAVNLHCEKADIKTPRSRWLWAVAAASVGVAISAIAFLIWPALFPTGYLDMAEQAMFVLAAVAVVLQQLPILKVNWAR